MWMNYSNPIKVVCTKWNIGGKCTISSYVVNQHLFPPYDGFPNLWVLFYLVLLTWGALKHLKPNTTTNKSKGQ